MVVELASGWSLFGDGKCLLGEDHAPSCFPLLIGIVFLLIKKKKSREERKSVQSISAGPFYWDFSLALSAYLCPSPPPSSCGSQMPTCTLAQQNQCSKPPFTLSYGWFIEAECVTCPSRICILIIVQVLKVEFQVQPSKSSFPLWPFCLQANLSYKASNSLKRAATHSAFAFVHKPVRNTEKRRTIWKNKGRIITPSPPEVCTVSPVASSELDANIAYPDGRCSCHPRAAVRRQTRGVVP